MLTFRAPGNSAIKEFYIADVTLEKIRVGSIIVPGVNDGKQKLIGLSLSSIGDKVAEAYNDLLREYVEETPRWLTVNYDESYIPLVDVAGAKRALLEHDLVLIYTPADCLFEEPKHADCERIGTDLAYNMEIYAATRYGILGGVEIEKAMNQAALIIQDFQREYVDSRIETANSFVHALEMFKSWANPYALISCPVTDDELKIVQLLDLPFLPGTFGKNAITLKACK